MLTEMIEIVFEEYLLEGILLLGTERPPLFGTGLSMMVYFDKGLSIK
jgi:hypothetical protein